LHRLWSGIVELTQLESLKLLALPSMISSSELSDMFRTLQGLTCLDGIRLDEYLMESLCSLTKLKSLTLYLDSDVDKYFFSLSSLLQLTHLALRHVLTAQTSRIFMDPNLPLPGIWNETMAMLNSFKNLEILELRGIFDVDGQFSGHSLAGMKKIKRLILTHLILNDMFLSNLASLEQLKELKLVSCHRFNQFSFHRRQILD